MRKIVSDAYYLQYRAFMNASGGDIKAINLNCTHKTARLAFGNSFNQKGFASLCYSVHIIKLTSTSRYDFSDPRPQKQFNYLRAFLHEKAAGPLTVVPWLKYVPTFSSIYNNIIASMTKFRQALSEVIADQK